MSSKSKSQLLKGVLEGCILAVMAHEEIYGYELSVKLAEYGLTFVSEGSIYPVLLRMQKEKLIVGTLKDSPNGPPRKYYQLTDEGRRALEVFKRDWMDMKEAVDRILHQGRVDNARRG